MSRESSNLVSLPNLLISLSFLMLLPRKTRGFFDVLIYYTLYHRICKGLFGARVKIYYSFFVMRVKKFHRTALFYLSFF